MRLLRNILLSSRALSRARARTLLSASGITLGIAAVFILFAMTAGAEQAFSAALEAMGKNRLVVGAAFRDSDALRGEATRARTLTLADWQAITQEVAGVARAAPIAMGSFELSFEGYSSTATVIGTSPDYRYTNAHHPASGRFIDDSDVDERARVVLLGAQIARELFKDKPALGARVLIGGAPFLVVGLLEEKGADAGGMQQDDKVLIPVTTAMRRLLNVDSVDRIFVQAESRDAIAAVSYRLRELLRERHGLNQTGKADDFTIRDQASLLNTLRQSDATLQRFLAGLSVLLLTLASIGLLAVSLLSVRERHAEIGLRLAVGALPINIVGQFLLEAAMIALLGAIGGLFAGGAGIILGEWLMGWTMQITGLNTLYTTLIPLLLALLAGTWPALRAAGLDPITALRG